MGTTVIAIDGPAASGKSTVAREIGSRLGFVYVNTGDMYRAATWLVLHSEVDPGSSERVADCVASADFECVIKDGRTIVTVDGCDPDEGLRSPEVNGAVSAVASVPSVRERLVAIQRAFAREHDVVMEGRDIGTVVCPETPYKLYIDASPEVRARRRGAQGYQDEINARDKADSSRKASPLTIAPDAQVIDSSDLGVAEVVAAAFDSLRSRGLDISHHAP